MKSQVTITALLISATGIALLSAQERRPPQFVSPEVGADRKVEFRIHAPGSEGVALSSPDLEGVRGRAAMERGDDGVWQLAWGPVKPGAYRYRFAVDGVDVVDPRNPATSESNTTAWSVVHVPGSEVFDTSDVPHGAVSEVTYYSRTLERHRRMHVYTPPGYGRGAGEYPVFYLLHGATDGDDSWSTVGRAGFILDNLIAAGKAKPMLVVMPHGHTGPFQFGQRGSFESQMEEFVTDFQRDIRPYVEENYRALTDRANRALAGLSMGGAHTLMIGMADLQDYGYLGVFSSGVFGIERGSDRWEEQYAEALADLEARKGLELFWFATGKDDFLLKTTEATVGLLKKHGYDVVYRETQGGHTWLNWRDYLVEFVPQLFQ